MCGTKDSITIPAETITTCSECPFCVWDSYYSVSKSSGYDCKKEGCRIIDDWEYEKKKYKNIPIPDWCPFRE